MHQPRVVEPRIQPPTLARGEVEHPVRQRDAEPGAAGAPHQALAQEIEQGRAVEADHGGYAQIGRQEAVAREAERMDPRQHGPDGLPQPVERRRVGPGRDTVEPFALDPFQHRVGAARDRVRLGEMEEPRGRHSTPQKPVERRLLARLRRLAGDEPQQHRPRRPIQREPQVGVDQPAGDRPDFADADLAQRRAQQRRCLLGADRDRFRVPHPAFPHAAPSRLRAKDGDAKGRRRFSKLVVLLAWRPAPTRPAFDFTSVRTCSDEKLRFLGAPTLSAKDH